VPRRVIGYVRAMRRLLLEWTPVLLIGACATGGGGGRDAGASRADAQGDAAVISDAAFDAPSAFDDAPPSEDASAHDTSAASDAFFDLDASVLSDAFAAPDALNAPDTFFAVDAFVPDAFRSPDAFAPDAFVVRDAFVPPDAFLPLSCGDVADCGRCAAGYCVAGSCDATNPTTVSYDFEAGLPPGWSNGAGGTAAWTLDTTGPRGGARALRSGAIGHSAQSRVSFSITLLREASLSFWMRTSSETRFDLGQLYVDGALRHQASGSTDWTRYETSLGAGAHTLELRYTKDGSIVAGSDAVWIDDLVIGAVSDASSGFETAGLPDGYTSAGAVPWSTVTTMPQSGSRCAESGNIADGETSSMTRSVTLASPQTLTFWVRTSTEASYDRLRAFVDGAMRGEWSGTTPWTLVSYPLTAGEHTVEWRYVKDLSISSGSDAVWIDDVSFGPPPVAGPLCGP
jgi:hypothetical protein